MLYLTCAVAALLMTFVGSYWIDKLYEVSTDIMSFPDEVAQRARFRKPILAIALFGLNVYFSQAPSPECFYLMIAAFFLLLITMTDFEQYLIFNKMLLPFTIIGLIAIFHLNLPLNIHLGTALFGGGLFLIIASLSRGALGGGDVKLIAALGIWLGYPKLSDVIVTGCILAGVAALIMLVTKLKDRRSYFAYGPYFALTAIYTLCSSLALE